MCEQTELPHSVFWQKVYLPGITYSAAIFLAAILILLFVPEAHPVDWHLLSPIEACAVYAVRDAFLLLIVCITSPIAIWGYHRAQKELMANRILVTYACCQILAGLLITCAHIYLIIHGHVVTQQSHGLLPPGINLWDFADLINWFIWFGFWSFPLVILMCRVAYKAIYGTGQQVDSSGRFLKCQVCQYDLRGTPGHSCPECGASVLSNKNRN